MPPQLARVMVDLAESRHIAPCLTLHQFERMFSRLATARAAAAAALKLLGRAHEALRGGDAASAAAALAEAAQAASAGRAAGRSQPEAAGKAAGAQAEAERKVPQAGRASSGKVAGAAVGEAAGAAATADAAPVAAPAAGSCEAGGGVRAAAALALRLAEGEAAELVLAPRCCVEARLRLAQLLLWDPADQEVGSNLVQVSKGGIKRLVGPAARRGRRG